jgi:hypothetical protein
MADPIDELENDAALVGRLAKAFDGMGLLRGTEVLAAVEHELKALAHERRAACAKMDEVAAAAAASASAFDALRVEVGLFRRELADWVAVIRKVTAQGPRKDAS